MKIKKVLLLLAIIISTPILSQPWFTTGNTVGTSDYLGSVNNAQLAFKTFSITRMTIEGGNGSLNTGRIAIGNNLPAGFVPQARLHLHQIGGSPLLTNDTYIRFTNNFTNFTNTDGFAIGNTNGLFTPNGDVRMLQYEQAPLIMLAPNSNTSSPNLLPYEWFRIENKQTFLAAPSASPLARICNPCLKRDYDLVALNTCFMNSEANTKS